MQHWFMRKNVKLFLPKIGKNLFENHDPNIGFVYFLTLHFFAEPQQLPEKVKRKSWLKIFL
jgi:hypothetical protein